MYTLKPCFSQSNIECNIGEFIKLVFSMETVRIFAARLKARREQLGLSQPQLASLIDRPQQRLSEWEKGKVEPRADTIVALARVLKVSTDWLLGVSDVKRPSQ